LELARRCVRGDQEAGALLAERHSEALFGYVSRLAFDERCKRDYCATTWTKVFDAVAKTGQCGRGSFEAGLFRIARNVCRTRPPKARLAEVPMPPDLAAKEEDPAKAAEQSEELQRLELALWDLPPEQFAALSIYCDKGKYKHVAAILEIPQTTAYERCQAALKALRRKLGGDRQ